MLAALLGHGNVALLGNCLQLEEIPVSERRPSSYLSVKQHKHSLRVLGIQFGGADKEGTSFKTTNFSWKLTRNVEEQKTTRPLEAGHSMIFSPN